MVVRVGVIGTGVMGSDHARLFATEIGGATLVAVADPDQARAQAAARGARVFADAYGLIADPGIDAVVIASPDPTHDGLVRACLDVGKPVLCEKPLALTADQALQIVRAERATGHTLVHTGFMRRFDPAYRELKAALADGSIGAPRIIHNQHRNASVPPAFTGAMAITNSFVHEIDICRWLLAEEYASGTVLPSRHASGPLAGDPQMITLVTAGGTIVSTEVFIDAVYGYHVHCEIVGSTGTAALAAPALTRTRAGRAERAAFPGDWIPRFADAYRLQDQAWIDTQRGGDGAGLATARDGYVATAIAEQLVAAPAGTMAGLTLEAE